MRDDSTELLTVLLTQVLPMSPLLLVWFAAGVYALATWGRHPMVSLLALIAVLMQTAATLFGTLATWLVIRSRGDLTAMEVGRTLAILSFGRICLSALAYGALFIAVFGWRMSPVKRFPYPPDDGPLPAEPGDERIRR